VVSTDLCYVASDHDAGMDMGIAWHQQGVLSLKGGMRINSSDISCFSNVCYSIEDLIWIVDDMSQCDALSI
jgi:hypothetical protein